MTMILQSISCVKGIQKFLVGNYEPIMGICGKIIIICTICKCCSCCELNKNFQNVYPLNKHEAPVEGLLATVLPTSADMGLIRRQFPQIFFVPRKLRCAQKNLF